MTPGRETSILDFVPALSWKYRRTGLFLADLLLIVALLIAAVSWLIERLILELGFLRMTVSWGIKPVAFLLIALVLRVALSLAFKQRGWSARGLIGNPWVGPLVLGVTMVFALLWGWETVLERRGFAARIPPIVIVGKDETPRAKSKYHFMDPELLWRWRPGAVFNGRPVNRMGFLDREVDPAKKPGAIRVICMGCSCTGQGLPPYSGHLHALLNAEEPGKWDAFNMGVHGYSTSQGLRLFQNQGADLQPDIVTVYYGWNDHWRAQSEDSKRMARRVTEWQASLIRALQEKRFFQYLVHQGTPSYENVLNDDESVLRVPPDEYRNNLLQFIAEIRAVGAVPILIAAPRGRTLTPLLVRNGQVASIESGIELHDRYLGILYAVAEETGTALVDLARAMNPALEKEYMSDDGIHCQNAGIAWVAGELHKAIREIMPVRQYGGDLPAS